MIQQTMITNRTQFDVDRYAELKAKGWQNMSDAEKAEWSQPLKGCYNYTDMNRVESAVEFVAARLRCLGYSVPTLTVKTDWNKQDIPTREDIGRYYGNVAILREIIGIGNATPQAPTIYDRLTHSRANDLEQILVNIDSSLDRLIESWYYVGELYAGEV